MKSFFTIIILAFSISISYSQTSEEVFIADIFTPNGDGKNDELAVRGNNIIELDFLVYDRWGNLVFQTRQVDEGWDGKKAGKDMPAGVYLYYIKASMIDGKEYEFKSDVTLSR